MAILRLISDTSLVSAPEITELVVLDAWGDDGSKTPWPADRLQQVLLAKGMRFGCLPGTTIEHLTYAASQKNSLAIQLLESGTMWYATARVECFEFDTVLGLYIMETQNAKFLVKTKPAPSPTWPERQISRIKFWLFGQ